MQKCLGELLDEDNERQTIKKIMADKDIKSDTPLTKISEPISDDLGKYIWNHVKHLYFILLKIFLNLDLKIPCILFKNYVLITAYKY